MAGVHKLCPALTGFSQNCPLAGSGNGKKGQIGVIRNVRDAAGDPSYSKLSCPHLLKDMGGSHSGKAATPGNDRPDHTPGATGNELVS